MNILATGIHVFVGNNIVAALKDQHTIYGLDMVSPQKEGVEIAAFRFAFPIFIGTSYSPAPPCCGTYLKASKSIEQII